MTFRFDTHDVHYSHDANPEHADKDIVHDIPSNKLIPQTRTTWTERLFYGFDLRPGDNAV